MRLTQLGTTTPWNVRQNGKQIEWSFSYCLVSASCGCVAGRLLLVLHIPPKSAPWRQYRHHLRIATTLTTCIPKLVMSFQLAYLSALLQVTIFPKKLLREKLWVSNHGTVFKMVVLNILNRYNFMIVSLRRKWMLLLVILVLVSIFQHWTPMWCTFQLKWIA